MMKCPMCEENTVQVHRIDLILESDEWNLIMWCTECVIYWHELIPFGKLGNYLEKMIWIPSEETA